MLFDPRGPGAAVLRASDGGLSGKRTAVAALNGVRRPSIISGASASSWPASPACRLRLVDRDDDSAELLALNKRRSVAEGIQREQAGIGARFPTDGLGFATQCGKLISRSICGTATQKHTTGCVLWGVAPTRYSRASRLAGLDLEYVEYAVERGSPSKRDSGSAYSSMFGLPTPGRPRSRIGSEGASFFELEIGRLSLEGFVLLPAAAVRNMEPAQRCPELGKRRLGLSISIIRPDSRNPSAGR